VRHDEARRHGRCPPTDDFRGAVCRSSSAGGACTTGSEFRANLSSTGICGCRQTLSRYVTHLGRRKRQQSVASIPTAFPVSEQELNDSRHGSCGLDRAEPPHGEPRRRPLNSAAKDQTVEFDVSAAFG
jgi:hypothetical protein